LYRYIQNSSDYPYVAFLAPNINYIDVDIIFTK
ncbi:MAG: hypothetical protein ACI9YH_001744, partial [Colwellia sp.]